MLLSSVFKLTSSILNATALVKHFLLLYFSAVAMPLYYVTATTFETIIIIAPALVKHFSCLRLCFSLAITMPFPPSLQIPVRQQLSLQLSVIYNTTCRILATIVFCLSLSAIKEIAEPSYFLRKPLPCAPEYFIQICKLIFIELKTISLSHDMPEPQELQQILI